MKAAQRKADNTQVSFEISPRYRNAPQWITASPINTVTPRRGELAAAGRVVQGGTKKNEHGRRVSWWRPAAAQLDLFGARGS